jgi:hypothetical protein
VQTYREHVWRQADYERLFEAAPTDARTGEATPFYLHDLGSHARIKALVPDARLILLLRELLHRKRGTRPVTTRQERAALLPHFTDDITLLQQVTGERYDDWLSVDRYVAAPARQSPLRR